MVDEVVTGSVRIRDMPDEAFGELLRAIGPEVGRLKALGDPLAISVMAYYVYAHNHPNDPQALLNVRTAVEDYMSRDLRVDETKDLNRKFGHPVNGEDKKPSPRIFVPGSGSSQ